MPASFGSGSPDREPCPRSVQKTLCIAPGSDPGDQGWLGPECGGSSARSWRLRSRCYAFRLATAMTGNRLYRVNIQKKVTVSHLNQALLAAHGSASGDRRLPARIQPTSATKPDGLSKSSALCGPTKSIPVCGRATPSLHRGWTNSEPWCNINNSLGLTHSLARKVGPGHRQGDDAIVGLDLNTIALGVRLEYRGLLGG